jgi:hypothetical protein
MEVALCLIANYYLESDYIIEYCEYYFGLGIDTIYILDDLNGREERLIDIPYIKEKADEGKIVYTGVQNHPTHWQLYPWFYNNFKDKFDWCCFFDCDEFLYLPVHKGIKEFINDEKLGFNDNCDVIQVSWRIYGDNGFTHKPDGKVRDNFRGKPYVKNKCENKVIVHGGLQNLKMFIGHAAIDGNHAERIKYSNGSIRYAYDPFFLNPDYSVAALEHYGTKSAEEYIKRKLEGNPDTPQIPIVQLFPDYRKSFFELNESTPEKEAMFDEAFKKLKNEL